MTTKVEGAAVKLRQLMTQVHCALNPYEKTRRAQALSDIAAEVEQEMAGLDSAPAATVELITALANNYTTKTITCIRDGLSGTGWVQRFINYHTYVTNEEHLRVAVHYKDSGITKTFSITKVLKRVNAALGRGFVKRHPVGTAEYRTVLDVLTVATSVSQNMVHIQKAKTLALQAEGYSRMEADHIIREQMLNDGSTTYLMTKELASVITEYPDRAQEIGDFLGRNLMTPVHADLDLLRIYLGTESRAMVEGVL